MRSFTYIILGLGALAISGFAQAQEDEIIVTATKRESSVPGIVLEKRGDFLLLEVDIENDSRGLDVRMSEISQTVENIIAAAELDPSIQLSMVDENDLVRPLSLETFTTGIRGGARPDTSIAYLKVKTPIPDSVADSYKLATKLGVFIEAIDEVGRTTIDASDEISVSVVNPYQYRKEVLNMVLSEIKEVTTTLGPEYRAVITGIDGEVQWVRSGDLSLAFYLPYNYDILPATLTTMSPDY